VAIARQGDPKGEALSAGQSVPGSQIQCKYSHLMRYRAGIMRSMLTLEFRQLAAAAALVVRFGPSAKWRCLADAGYRARVGFGDGNPKHRPSNPFASAPPCTLMTGRTGRRNRPACQERPAVKYPWVSILICAVNVSQRDFRGGTTTKSHSALRARGRAIAFTLKKNVSYAVMRGLRTDGYTVYELKHTSAR